MQGLAGKAEAGVVGGAQPVFLETEEKLPVHPVELVVHHRKAQVWQGWPGSDGSGRCAARLRLVLPAPESRRKAVMEGSRDDVPLFPAKANAYERTNLKRFSTETMPVQVSFSPETTR